MIEPRYAGMLVILEADIHGDNAKATLAAIARIKGVLSVEPVIGDDELEMAEHRERVQLGARLIDVLYAPSEPKAGR